MHGMTVQRDLNDRRASVMPLLARVLAGVLVAVLGFNTSSVCAAPLDELKAAYLLNFAKFTTWPPDQFAAGNSPVVFCGVANEPVMDAMRALGERRVDNRVVRIRTLKDPRDNAGCHVLYSGQQTQPVSAHPDALRRRGLLLVGDAGNFLQQGGTISYFLQQGKLRFEISLENARAVDLVLSARLLSLARHREGEP